MNVTRARQKLLEHWAEHPWNWLTGKDLDGRPIVWTKDERDEQNPFKPFPEKEYLRRYVDVLYRNKVVLVDKCRQMLVSTASLLVMDWFCRFKDGRRCLVSKHKEQEAVELINDKIRVTHAHLPDWLQEQSPQEPRPKERIDYPRTWSYIRAVAQNVAESEARGGTASIILIDEAAFQEQFGDIMGAAAPMAARIWAVTTANIGNPGATLFKILIDEGKRAA